MGSNNGTGEPSVFRCSACRRKNPLRKRQLGERSFTYEYELRRPTGYADRVRLTGRKRRHSTGGIRHGTLSREYECLDCGHVGWSRHIDLDQLDPGGTRGATRRRRGSKGDGWPSRGGIRHMAYEDADSDLE